ncbi:MAG: hypothetical protein CVV13_03145 [Gammaproteobacteria bacterium HGW-Gammaproteobacteria-3]|nr:MAG: hypothetical protein CVV13_03145 [Gammaproteobacteria bacterium HGW-Gammaproteobacteria-3]
MGTFSGWESLLLGALLILLIFWMRPGIKASLEQSKNATADWPGVLVPLVFVVMFVIFLVAMV